MLTFFHPLAGLDFFARIIFICRAKWTLSTEVGTDIDAHTTAGSLVDACSLWTGKIDEVEDSLSADWRLSNVLWKRRFLIVIEAAYTLEIKHSIISYSTSFLGID